MKQNQKKQHGYTIVEILIGVIVAAIVVAGIYAGWNSFYTSNQATTVAGDVTQIIQNTETVYSKSADQYASLTVEAANQNQIFPSSLRISADGKSTYNSFGGAVTLAPVDSNAGQFVLTYAAIPSAVCQKILSSISTSNINSIKIASADFWTTGSTFPSVAEIQKACTAKTTVDMAFTAS